MKLFRLRVHNERVVAEDAATAADQWHANPGESHIAMDELDEPEATLYLTQDEITMLTRAVGNVSIPRVGENAYRATQRSLKTKLDGLVWQLAAQRTMLEKAQ